MRRLCRAASLLEAYPPRGLLECCGGGVRVLNEHAHGALGEIPFTQAWPKLRLEDDRDLDRALRTAEARWADTPRECAACSERNPPRVRGLLARRPAGRRRTTLPVGLNGPPPRGSVGA